MRLLKNGNVLYKNQVEKVQEKTLIDVEAEESVPMSVSQCFTITANVEGSLVRMYDDLKNFYGIYEYRKEQRIYKPYKMFLPNEL